MEQRTVPAWLAAPDRGPKEAKPFALLLLLIKFPFISPTANVDAGYAHTPKISFTLLLYQHRCRAHMQQTNRQTSTEVSEQPQLEVGPFCTADGQNFSQNY